MSAPIPYTCPDIDAIKEDLRERRNELDQAFDDLENGLIDKAKDLIDGVNQSIAEYINNNRNNPLEELRTSNDTLRRYGEDMEEQRDQLDDKLSTVEAEVESLEDQLKDLQKEMTELKNELDNESNQRLALEDEVVELKAKLLMYIKP